MVAHGPIKNYQLSFGCLGGLGWGKSEELGGLMESTLPDPIGEMCNDTVKERYEQHSTVLGKMIIMVNALCFEVKTKFSAASI